MITVRWPRTDAAFPQVEFRRLFRQIRRPAADDAAMVTAYTDGVVTLRSKRRLDGYHEAADMSGMQGVRVGDFVVHGLDILRGSVGVSDADGAISSVCVICAPVADVEPRYFAWQIRAQAASGLPRALARGVREGGADFRRWDTLAELPVLCPPPGVQKAIADYLDTETARIDALIAKKQQMIELLKERLQSYIERVVYGLMSTSSTKLKYIAKILAGQSPPEETYNLDGVGIPLINGPAEFQEGDWGFSTAGRFTTDARVVTESGDVLICLRGSTTGRMNRTSIRSAAGRGVAAIRGLELPNDLIFYCLLARRRELLAVSTGATFASVTAEDLGALAMPKISVSDCSAALSRLDRQVDVSRSIVSALGVQAALLRERRQALITAAVTGELEVPGVAA